MYDFSIRLCGSLAAACVFMLLAACGGVSGTPAPMAEPPAPMAEAPDDDGGGGAPAPSDPPAPMAEPPAPMAEAPDDDGGGAPAPMPGADDDGGGDGPPAPMPAVTELPPVPTVDEHPEDDFRTVLGRAAASAATSRPRFGSVTQSSNRDASRVTTDTVSVMHGGEAGVTGSETVTVKIARQDASTLTLTRPEDSPVSRSREGGRLTIDAALTTGETNGGITTGKIRTTFKAVPNSFDPESWDRYIVAAGYWLHLKAGSLQTPADITGAEVGAFIDGPEFSGPSPDLPSGGTASYRGTATGYYAWNYGTDNTHHPVPPGPVPPGSWEVGDFVGIATLTADFSSGKVKGCIGCESDGLTDLALGLPEALVRDEVVDRLREDGGLWIESRYHHAASTGATMTNERYFEYGASYRLDEIPIVTAAGPSAGTFQGEGITVRNRYLDRDRIVEAESAGRWSGRFSNIPGPNGPRGVAGTFAGTVATDGNSRHSYVGAFSAEDR